MTGNERPPRALLPRISPEERVTPELTSETSHGSQDTSAPARVRALPGARSNIRSACLACRQRRSKCSGGTPCGRCRTRGTDCVYEELQDRRTRAVRGKGKEELDLHRKVIDGIFKAIREGGDQAIFDLVRQNASLEEIAAVISDELPESDSEDDITQPSPDLQPPILTPLTRESTRAPWGSVQAPLSGLATTSEVDALARMQHNAFTGERGAVETSFETTPRNLTPNISMMHHDQILFPWMLKPLNFTELAPSDSLSHFYVQFREGSQHLILQGMPTDAIIGPMKINCSLFFRANQYEDTFNLSAWAASVVNGLSDLDGYFKLAWFVLLVRFMRWSIEPTEENFAMVPDAIRPTPLQLSTPHVPFIDLIPLPCIRDSMITNGTKTFDVFGTALQLAGATMYWADSFDEVVHHDPVNGNMTITDRFEKHVANVDHYRFGGILIQTFPELKGLVNVVEQDHIATIPFSSDLT